MDGMECYHPFFDGKGWAGMIISHDNQPIPPKCPLKKLSVTTTVKLHKSLRSSI